MIEAQKINDKDLISKMFNLGLVVLAASVVFSISAMNNAFIFLFITFVYKAYKKEISYVKTGLEFPILLAAAFYSLSAIVNPQTMKGLQYMVRNFWQVLYMYAVIYLFGEEEITKFVKIMAWAAVAIAVYAILQSFLGLHTTMSLRLPDETIMMVKPRDEVVMTVLGWPVRMGTGLMGLHLTYGGQIMMMSFFVWAVLKKKWAFALVVVSIFLSFAYSAWLGFVAALSLFYGFRKKTAKYSILLLVVFFTVLFTVPGNRQKVMHKLTDRIRIWNISLQMYSTNPAFGIGPKRFKYIYEDKYLEKYPGAKLGHSHSVYLDLLTEGGPLTFLAFLFFVWRFLKKYGKRVKGKFRNLHTASLLALLGIAVAGFFQNYHTAAENSVLIWIIIGLTVKIKLLEKEEPNKRP